jgi:hypothetical protein
LPRAQHRIEGGDRPAGRHVEEDLAIAVGVVGVDVART